MAQKLEEMFNEIRYPSVITTDKPINFGDKSLSQTIKGSVKVDVRPTGGSSADYAEQIRANSAKASGTFLGLDNESHLVASGSASIMSTRGVAVVDSGITCTSGTVIGTYGQARADGTVAGSAFVAGLYGLVEASAAITASHVCSIWADSHQANAVTGSHQLIYATNNGAAQMDEVLYVYGGDKITSLMELNTVEGMVSDTAETGGSSKKIKITIDGVVHYINAYTG